MRRTLKKPMIYRHRLGTPRPEDQHVWALRHNIQRLASTRAGAWFCSHIAHRLDILIMRLSKGRYSLTSVLAGLPVVTLTTFGARSGQPRTLPLVAIQEGELVVLIASNFGRAHHPAWYHNLRTNPEARLTIHGHTKAYIAHEATGAERERYWRQAVELYAGYAAYERRAGGREIPVMVLTCVTPIVQGGQFAFRPLPLPALASDEAGIKATLAECDLPYEDITPDHLQHFWILRDGPKLAGVVGLEVFESVGLLRSLAVQEAYRGQGIGSQLTEMAEDYARVQGIKALYLLTTTAPDFFGRRGYQQTERDAAPTPLQGTVEFKSLCPDSAVCMVKKLGDS